MMLRPSRLVAVPFSEVPLMEAATHRHQSRNFGTWLAMASSQGVGALPATLMGCKYSSAPDLVASATSPPSSAVIDERVKPSSPTAAADPHLAPRKRAGRHMDPVEAGFVVPGTASQTLQPQT
jgi:hypothetical protein